jgi:flagellar biogenesis protein FliO
MGTFALGADERVATVEVTEDVLVVGLMDGRTISVPLACSQPTDNGLQSSSPTSDRSNRSGSQR